MLALVPRILLVILDEGNPGHPQDQSPGKQSDVPVTQNEDKNDAGKEDIGRSEGSCIKTKNFPPSKRTIARTQLAK